MWRGAVLLPQVVHVKAVLLIQVPGPGRQLWPHVLHRSEPAVAPAGPSSIPLSALKQHHKGVPWHDLMV